MKKMVYSIAIILVFALSLSKVYNKTLSSELRENKKKSLTLICKNKGYLQHQAYPLKQTLLKKWNEPNSEASNLANTIFFKNNSTLLFIFHSKVIYLSNNQSPG